MDFSVVIGSALAHEENNFKICGKSLRHRCFLEEAMVVNAPTLPLSMIR
jgi:hypothetical protein